MFLTRRSSRSLTAVALLNFSQICAAKPPTVRIVSKHSIDFTDAYKIFEYPFFSKVDDRFNYQEKRYIGIGKLEDVIVVFVYTKRGKNIRIISIHKANYSFINTQEGS